MSRSSSSHHNPPDAAPLDPAIPSTARHQWRDADAEQRRELIVDVALELLHTRGLDALTMRNVASGVGVGTMTLYTYVQGQEELRQAMIRRGFAMICAACRAHSTLDGQLKWWGGARAYVDFAQQNPNLYRLMFSDPVADSPGDERVLRDGLQPLLDRVRERLAERGLTGEELRHQAMAATGRYWICLHGLASLAIAGRLNVLGNDLDSLLADLLDRVAPD